MVGSVGEVRGSEISKLSAVDPSAHGGIFQWELSAGDPSRVDPSRVDPSDCLTCGHLQRYSFDGHANARGELSLDRRPAVLGTEDLP